MKSSLYGAGAEYALHSLLILAARSEPVSVRDLARFQELPERFLAKLFTRLEKAGLVEATEGVRGGFVLARPPARITVRDVLEAVDSSRTLFECAEIRRHCALFGAAPPAWSISGMCRIHLFMKEAEEALQGFLASKTLANLGHEFGRKAPEPFLRDAEAWFQERRTGRTAAKSGGRRAAKLRKP
ncbi:MAG TPA: Rrf2 family transcriptional regulator [Anaeromyxobacteraceae bacterium]